MTDGVRIARDGDLLTVTFARPEKGNALKPEAMEIVADAFATANKEGARALLLTGEGDRFCVGADLVAANTGGGRSEVGDLSAVLERGANRMVQSIWECGVPTVAAVQGPALGIGFHAALACDLVIAEESAYFSEPFALRGFSVDSGGSYLLPRLAGMSRAKWMLYTGDKVHAKTAADWGIVHEVVPDAGVRATEIAERLAAGPTVALAAMKRLVQDHQNGSIGDSLRAEAATVELTIRTADFKAGIKAFLGRTTPEFSGH